MLIGRDVYFRVDEARELLAKARGIESQIAHAQRENVPKMLEQVIDMSMRAVQLKAKVQDSKGIRFALDKMIHSTARLSPHLSEEKLLAYFFTQDELIFTHITPLSYKIYNDYFQCFLQLIAKFNPSNSCFDGDNEWDASIRVCNIYRKFIIDSASVRPKDVLQLLMTCLILIKHRGANVNARARIIKIVADLHRHLSIHNPELLLPVSEQRIAEIFYTYSILTQRDVSHWGQDGLDPINLLMICVKINAYYRLNTELIQCYHELACCYYFNKINLDIALNFFHIGYQLSQQFHIDFQPLYHLYADACLDKAKIYSMEARTPDELSQQLPWLERALELFNKDSNEETRNRKCIEAYRGLGHCYQKLGLQGHEFSMPMRKQLNTNSHFCFSQAVARLSMFPKPTTISAMIAALDAYRAHQTQARGIIKPESSDNLKVNVRSTR